jgi:hypothetical protein
LSLSQAKQIIKVKQAFTNIQQPRASRYFFNNSLRKFSSSDGNLAHAHQISQLFILGGFFNFKTIHEIIVLP